MKAKIKLILIWLIVIIVIVFIIYASGEGSKIQHQHFLDKGKYKVILSNWVGRATYYCNSYKQENNTYMLFDSYGNLKNQFTITDGYACRIEINRGE